jgi:hypothetical protein
VVLLPHVLNRWVEVVLKTERTGSLRSHGAGTADYFSFFIGEPVLFCESFEGRTESLDSKGLELRDKNMIDGGSEYMG